MRIVHVFSSVIIRHCTSSVWEQPHHVSVGIELLWEYGWS